MATRAEIESAISTLEAELAAMAGSNTVDYTEGDITVKQSQRHNQIIKQLEYWRKQLEGISELDTAAFDYDVNEFGQDNGQYES